MSDDESSASSSSDDDGDRLTVEGLSLDTLQALQHFQQHGRFLDDDGDDGVGNSADPTASISKDTVCVSYTAKDSQVIADTYKRLQQKADSQAASSQEQLQQRVISQLQQPDAGIDNNASSSNTDKAAVFLAELKDKGVVRINNVLTKQLAAACLESINTALQQADSNKAGTLGFGNVFSRNCRYDMYLRPQEKYQEALQSMLSKDSVLGELFAQWVPDKSGVFHEFSALVADPGAESQPIHPDAPFNEIAGAPLLTVFCALQDIAADMGPTTFLHGSNTVAVHDALTSSNKDSMLAGSDYRHALLSAGDCTIMDARTLHFGSANTSSERRCLLYFTIRNPTHGSVDADFPDCGSLFDNLTMSTSDYYQ